MKHKFRTLTTLLAASTTAIHIYNKLQSGKYQDKKIHFEDENNYYDYRFGKIRYIKKGTGKPILLIHSLDVGSSSYEFHNIIERLSENHTVYALDLLGYGLSEKPEITYTNYLYIQLVDEFIKNVIKEKTEIISSGDSSSIALMQSHLNKDTVSKIYMINPQYIFDMNLIPSKKSKMLQNIFELPIYGTFIYNLLNNSETIKNKFLTEYYYDPANVKEDDVDAFISSAKANSYGSKYSFSSKHNNYTNINFLQALKNTESEIVIIGGSDYNDIQMNIDNYKYYNKAITAHMIPNTKKLPHLENPSEVLNCLTI